MFDILRTLFKILLKVSQISENCKLQKCLMDVTISNQVKKLKGRHVSGEKSVVKRGSLVSPKYIILVVNLRNCIDTNNYFN